MTRKKWEKSPPALVKRFNELLPGAPDVEKRMMFGYPCSFVNRNMFMGLFADKLFVRLSEPDRQDFLKLDQAEVFAPMEGRPMKEYVVIPEWLLNDPHNLEPWIERSFRYVLSLPPKQKR